MKRNRAVFPARVSLLLTGSAPSIRSGQLLTPAAASMTLTGFAPSILFGQTYFPSSASLVLTGFAPTLRQVLTPSAASMTVTGSAPTLQTVLTPAASSMTLTGSAPVVTTSAPLSIIGTPGAANANTITLPTHAVGDDIYIFAFNGTGTTAVTKPTAAGTVPAWADIDAPAGSNGCSARTAHFVATATNHTSGTWTNATSMAVITVRGQNASPIGGHALSGGSATGQAVAPAVTLSVTDGSSMILEFYGQMGSSDIDAWDAAPTGYTRRAATTGTFQSTRACLNTKTVTTTDGSVTQTGATSSFSKGYQGATIEILH